MVKTESRSRYQKVISLSGGFRACYVDGTQAVGQLQSLQNSYPLASIAVGRAMMGAGLMAIMLDDDEGRISVHFNGDGPLGTVFGEANYKGQMRGYCTHPQLQLPYVPSKPLSLGKAIGHGPLTVVRTSKKFAEPQQGVVQIQSGEIAEDLTFFMTASYQIPSAIVLGVGVNEYGRVTSAGGLYVEMMPDADEDSIVQIESNLKQAPAITELVKNHLNVQEIFEVYFKGFDDLKNLECDAIAEFRCQCNQHRFETSLQLFPLEELVEMQTKNEPIQAHCEFCGKRYIIQPPAIGRVIRIKQDL
ncbi:MAG: Hsp33 family molecular chaperone HslO [Bdellovibrionales bacterium]